MTPRGLDFEALERRANPTGAVAGTFYRAVAGAAVDESKALLNQPPRSYRAVKGDFSVNGGFYMTADKAGAEQVRLPVVRDIAAS